MDPLGLAEAVIQVCRKIYGIWEDMQALKKELKPFRDIAHVVEDVLTHGEHSALTLGPVLQALNQAAKFLSKYHEASQVERLIHAGSLRNKAKDILLAISNALQPVQLQEVLLPQATSKAYDEIHRLQAIVKEAQQSILLQAAVQHTVLVQHMDRLQHNIQQRGQCSEGMLDEVLQGQAHILRALNLQQPPADQPQLADDARQQLKQAQDDKASRSEHFLLEQVRRASGA
ncbi:hypothetical protein MMC07_002609 [Pseudocyphellaria aurata]|nr:hypothetical protein [Pseudocyphellaria aurata]